MKMYFLFFSVLLATSSLQAQDNLSAADKEAAYNQTIATRAEKIVTALNLADTKKAETISELVADQYKDLNKVYTARDLERKEAREALAGDKEALQAKIKNIED
ncbi:MAG TPA: DUF3826 domain-containing protein, partial [Flavisolibacter sp.]|nr:DUF3826 domain-containing protein [Flavisolibacter sp.]